MVLLPPKAASKSHNLLYCFSPKLISESAVAHDTSACLMLETPSGGQAIQIVHRSLRKL